MTRLPLSFEQANDLCNDFQYISGRNFNNDESIIRIDRVVVAPYDDVNKYIFLLRYYETGDPMQALEMYEGSLFDVVVIGKVQSLKIEYMCKDLHKYLTENDIPFDITKYMGLV